jgi:5S rRNA maturation endonuclease (ribonuclease M5)
MPEIPKFITAEMLRAIRANADWRRLFGALKLERAKGKGNDNDWWALSPLTNEKTPSFHINAKGWYCHSTQQGGGVIELVQRVLEYRRGQVVSCWDAGRWLIEQGASQLDEAPLRNEEGLPRSEEKEKGHLPDRSESGINKGISADLVPRLVPDHPELRKRGISKETCKYLGCGYLSGYKGTINERIVFQVRGVEKRGGQLAPVILSHIGRTVDDVRADVEGRWHHFAHFKKHLELYNVDKILLDPRAREQVQRTGRLIIVEGCFDVAKLVEAGIYNVVATFGAHLSEEQARRVKLIAERLGVQETILWYDKDTAGREGAKKALDLLKATACEASAFWGTRDSRAARSSHVSKLPPLVKDPCDFSVEQLRDLREKGVV